MVLINFATDDKVGLLTPGKNVMVFDAKAARKLDTVSRVCLMKCILS